MDASSNSSARRRCWLGVGIGAWPTHRSAGWHSDAGLAPRPARSSGGGSGLDTTRCAGPLIALCPIRHYPKNSSTAVKPDAKLLGSQNAPRLFEALGIALAHELTRMNEDTPLLASDARGGLPH